MGAPNRDPRLSPPQYFLPGCRRFYGMTLPSVFSYIDYRTFLRDWFAARKREEPGYSYARFASDGGCSKSTLANVLSGARTPRAATLDAFARAMELTPSGRNYLGLLVELASASDLESRRRVMDRILASDRYGQVRFAEQESPSTVARYLEHWYIPAIRELAALPDFRPDPAWIARRLRPEISVDQADAALQCLFELDFLRHGSDGGVELREVQFRTEPEADQAAIMHFHRTQVPELLRHVRGEHAAEQHLLTGTIHLPPDLVTEVKARLDAFFGQVAVLADAAPDAEGARVYQYSAQLLPLTEAVDLLDEGGAS